MSNGAHPPQSLNQAANTSGVPMTTASMKIPRFGLVVSLYDSRPNRCGTCGRRFFATEKGKEMKARHLDWHFKTNQRMTESSRRAQNRSWYVDERVCYFNLVRPDSVLTVDRIGSNPVRLVTRTAPPTPRPPQREPPAMKVPNRNPPSHGFAPPTMRPSATPRVPSARRSLNRPGPRMSRTGSGKTPPRLALACIMRAATLKSPKALLRLVRPGLARPTRSSASVRLK